MNYQAGSLDRKIIIESSSTSSDEYGAAQTVTWSEWKRMFAQVKPVRARERFDAANLRAERMQIFLIRYIENLRSDMRIQYDNLVWNIRGLTTLGRREMIEILAEAQE